MLKRIYERQNLSSTLKREFSLGCLMLPYVFAAYREVVCFVAYPQIAYLPDLPLDEFGLATK